MKLITSPRQELTTRGTVFLRELFIFLRYSASSLITAAVDYLVFLTTYPHIQKIPLCIFLARLASILVNYLLLRVVVFQNREHVLRTLPSYVLLVAISGIITSLLIPQWIHWLKVSVVIAKMLSEAILYFINYAILKNLIFLRKFPSKKQI